MQPRAGLKIDHRLYPDGQQFGMSRENSVPRSVATSPINMHCNRLRFYQRSQAAEVTAPATTASPTEVDMNPPPPMVGFYSICLSYGGEGTWCDACRHVPALGLANERAFGPIQRRASAVMLQLHVESPGLATPATNYRGASQAPLGSMWPALPAARDHLVRAGQFPAERDQ